MPQKSIREMSRLERQHYSLASRSFRATIMGAVILGLIALAIGLGLYAVALGGQYIGEAFNLSRNAQSIICKDVNVEPLVSEVMERYYAMTPAQRENVDSDAYKAAFADITEREDYITARSMLADFLASSDVFDVYIVAYDTQTASVVYIADPEEDEEFKCLPGDWESDTFEGMNKFLNWDGTGRLYSIDKTEKYGWLATSGVPIRNADGEIFAFVMADISLAEMNTGMRSFVLQYSITMFILVNLVGVIMALRMKKVLVNPINKIASAAERYVQDKRENTGATGHFTDLQIATGDEVENLALIMSDMETDLSEYEENLARAVAEKERVGTELALATRIQAGMLPSIYPAFPERPEFDIYASMTPAKEVGGDFYDFFLVDDDHLCMVMADVSGKGIPAALFMMASKIILANNAKLGKSPAQILTDTNASICSNNHEEMFVTVWLGILELSTGKLTAANAGHEYPVFKKADGQFELLKDKHGFVIGGMDGARYKEYELQMEPGSKLFLYTDGVPEATDAQRELFGTERMLAALNEAADAKPKDTLQQMHNAVNDFVKDAEQFDDLTMLCVQYIGKEEQKDG